MLEKKGQVTGSILMLMGTGLQKLSGLKVRT